MTYLGLTRLQPECQLASVLLQRLDWGRLHLQADSGWWQNSVPFSCRPANPGCLLVISQLLATGAS